jgi:hypothetical protein
MWPVSWGYFWVVYRTAWISEKNGGEALAGTLESRIDRHLFKIEGRLHGYPQIETAVPASSTGMDEKIARYKSGLEIAIRNYPCGGCRRLVLGALVGLAIFSKMSEEGRERADLSDQEIDKIKKEVEQKYKDF